MPIHLVLPQNSENVIYFYIRQLEMPKIAFKKWRHHLYLLFDHCTAKYKDIALKLIWYVCCLHVFLQHIFHLFG